MQLGLDEGNPEKMVADWGYSSVWVNSLASAQTETGLQLKLQTQTD